MLVVNRFFLRRLVVNLLIKLRTFLILFQRPKSSFSIEMQLHIRFYSRQILSKSHCLMKTTKGEIRGRGDRREKTIINL